MSYCERHAKEKELQLGGLQLALSVNNSGFNMFTWCVSYIY